MGGKDRHIALLVPNLEIGGAQRRMALLARAFAERGCRVDLLVVDPGGPLREEVGPTVRLVPLDRWWTRIPVVKHKKRWQVMASAPSIIAYLRRERPQALMPTSHSACVTGILAWQLARVPTRCVARIDSQPSRAPELRGTRTQRRRLRRAESKPFTHFPTRCGWRLSPQESARAFASSADNGSCSKTNLDPPSENTRSPKKSCLTTHTFSAPSGWLT